MTDSKQELKPCPFCGSQAKSDLSDFGSAMVYCGAEDVGVDCPVNAETGFHDSMESSIAAWNTRPADTLTEARVRDAFDKIAAVNTVAICSLDEMEAIVNRALTGEFDADFAKGGK